MATLYEIDQAILDCIDMETGEVLDSERLDALQIERTAKIENVALWIKNLESDVDAIVTEMGKFAARKKEAETKAEQLKNWLAFATNGQKFSTARCAVTFRKSERVEIADGSKIPMEYMTVKTTYTPDKREIKQQLKAGVQIDGCSIVESINAQIK